MGTTTTEALLEVIDELKRSMVFEEAEVTVPRNLLDQVLHGLSTLIDMQTKEEKRSLSALYIGTLLGVLIGIIGNFFVSFWFQQFTVWHILGLIVTGTMLAATSVALFFQAKKYAA